MPRRKSAKDYSLYIIGAAVLLIAAISFANTGNFIALFGDGDLDAGTSDDNEVDLTKRDYRREISDSFLVTDDSADESSEQTFEDEPESPSSLSTPIRSWYYTATNTIDPNDVHISIGVNPRLGQYLRDGMIYGFNHATGYYSGFEIYTDHYINDPNTGYSGNSIRFLANGPNEYLILQEVSPGGDTYVSDEIYLYALSDTEYRYITKHGNVNDVIIKTHEGTIYLSIYDGVGARSEIPIEVNIDSQNNVIHIGDNMNDYIKNADGSWIISKMDIVLEKGHYILDYYEIYSL